MYAQAAKTSSSPSATPTASRRRSQNPAPMQRGDEGASVERLQDQLQWLGFLSAEDKATGHGIFGGRTESAVTAAEGKLGLQADGIADKKLQNTANKALADQNAATGIPGPLSKGAEGYRVKGLQDALHELGLLSAEALREGHGTFGNQTEAAVRALQSKNGIEENGTVGPATWTWLIQNVGRHATGKAGQNGVVVTGRPALKLGHEGPLVRELERLLAEYGADLKPDGTFDKSTRTAVRDFQRANGLSVDGTVGTATAAALVSGRAQSIEAGATGGGTGGGTGEGPEWLAQFLSSMGLRGEHLRVMWSIAMRESGGHPSTISSMDGLGFGVFQMQAGVGHEEWIAKEFGWDTSTREKFAALMTDPVKNFKVMMALSNNGKDLRAWGHTSVDDPSLNLAQYGNWGIWTTDEGVTWAQAYIVEPFTRYYGQFPSVAQKAGVSV